MRWNGKAARWMGAPARRLLGTRLQESAGAQGNAVTGRGQAVPGEQELAQRFREMTARREAAFTAGAPPRRAERRTRLIEWAERHGKSSGELAAAYHLDTVMGEASARRRLGLRPRDEQERAYYREWDELDADVVADVAQAARAEREREDGLLLDADEPPGRDGWRRGTAGSEADLEAGA